MVLNQTIIDNLWKYIHLELQVGSYELTSNFNSSNFDFVWDLEEYDKVESIAKL